MIEIQICSIVRVCKRLDLAYPFAVSQWAMNYGQSMIYSQGLFMFVWNMSNINDFHFSYKSLLRRNDLKEIFNKKKKNRSEWNSDTDMRLERDCFWLLTTAYKWWRWQRASCQWLCGRYRGWSQQMGLMSRTMHIQRAVFLRLSTGSILPAVSQPVSVEVGVWCVFVVAFVTVWNMLHSVCVVLSVGVG